MKKKRPRISGGYIKVIPLQKAKDNSVQSPPKQVNEGGAGADHSSSEDKCPDETK